MVQSGAYVFTGAQPKHAHSLLSSCRPPPPHTCAWPAAQGELKKANLLRDKLEELCRQLQKESREVAEDSKRRNDEESRQRQALQAKFTQAITVSDGV